jgi:hypothetical protein
MALFDFFYTNPKDGILTAEAEDSLGGYISNTPVNISDPSSILPEISHLRLQLKRFAAYRCIAVKYTGATPQDVVFSTAIPTSQPGGKLMTSIQLAAVAPNTVNGKSYINPVQYWAQPPNLTFGPTATVTNMVQNQVVGLWIKQVVTPAPQIPYTIVPGQDPQAVEIFLETAQLIIDYTNHIP